MFDIERNLQKLYLLMESGNSFVSTAGGLDFLAAAVIIEADALISDLKEVCRRYDEEELAEENFYNNDWKKWINKFKEGWMNETTIWNAYTLDPIHVKKEYFNCDYLEEIHVKDKTWFEREYGVDLGRGKHYYYDFATKRTELVSILQKLETRFHKAELVGLGSHRKKEKKEYHFSRDAIINYVERIEALMKDTYRYKGFTQILWNALMRDDRLEHLFEVSNYENKKEQKQKDFTFSKKTVGYIITYLRNKVYDWNADKPSEVLELLEPNVKSPKIKNYIKDSYSSIVISQKTTPSNEAIDEILSNSINKLKIAQT